MPAEQVQLDYSKGRPAWYRRPAAKYALLALLLMLLLLSRWGWKSAPGEWLRFIYWEQRCLRYTVAPGTPVYAYHDPKLIPSMLASGAASTEAWDYDAFFTVSEWTQLQRYFPLQWMQESTVFLHGRERPDGASRLVAVHVRPAVVVLGIPDASFEVPLLEAEVIRPSIGGPHLSGTTTSMELSPGDSLQIFAGQCDLRDPTRFKIRYNSSGRMGTIEGRVLADDSVVFRIVDGPLQIHTYDPGYITPTSN